MGGGRGGARSRPEEALTLRPAYRAEVTSTARKQIERLPTPIQVRVRLAIRALAVNPWPHGAALLAETGPDRIWRVRVGDYRVLYEIRDDVLLVLVVKVGHRREIFRGHRISDADGPYESINEL